MVKLKSDYNTFKDDINKRIEDYNDTSNIYATINITKFNTGSILSIYSKNKDKILKTVVPDSTTYQFTVPEAGTYTLSSRDSDNNIIVSKDVAVDTYGQTINVDLYKFIGSTVDTLQSSDISKLNVNDIIPATLSGSDTRDSYNFKVIYKSSDNSYVYLLGTENLGNDTGDNQKSKSWNANLFFNDKEVKINDVAIPSGVDITRNSNKSYRATGFNYWLNFTNFNKQQNDTSYIDTDGDKQNSNLSNKYGRIPLVPIGSFGSIDANSGNIGKNVKAFIYTKFMDYTGVYEFRLVYTNSSKVYLLNTNSNLSRLTNSNQGSMYYKVIVANKVRTGECSGVNKNFIDTVSSSNLLATGFKYNTYDRVVANGSYNDYYYHYIDENGIDRETQRNKYSPANNEGCSIIINL